MDSTEYSADPYEDGTVPADADFATSSADGAAKESDGPAATAPDSGDDASDTDDELIGSTGDGASDPNALVAGNRVATAEDME